MFFLTIGKNVSVDSSAYPNAKSKYAAKIHKLRKQTLIMSQRGGFFGFIKLCTYAIEKSTSSKTQNLYRVRRNKRSNCRYSC